MGESEGEKQKKKRQFEKSNEKNYCTKTSKVVILLEKTSHSKKN